jgi:rhodanese-related sulfurtransferase
MTSIPRISPLIARDQITKQNSLLVCAYDSVVKFAANRLEGAIPLTELQAWEDTLGSNQELIFYCACPDDSTAAGRAEEYRRKGFSNVKVLRGGVDAWTNEGFEVLPAV